MERDGRLRRPSSNPEESATILETISIVDFLLNGSCKFGQVAPIQVEFDANLIEFALKDPRSVEFALKDPRSIEFALKNPSSIEFDLRTPTSIEFALHAASIEFDLKDPEFNRIFPP